MQSLLGDTRHSLRASPVFAFYTLIALMLAAFNALMVAQMAFRLDIYLPGLFGAMQHGAVESHRVHDFTFGLLYTTGMVGMLAQLRRPSKNVTGMLMALAPFLGLVLAAFLSGSNAGVISDGGVIQRNPLYLVAAVTAVAALVHPAGRAFFRSFSVARINWVMLALVALVAVPMLGFASTNIGLQETVRDDHAGMGHYAFMAAFGFTVIGVGGLASLRLDGWRLTAWVAGLLPALVGVWSLAYPDVASSLDLGWALAAVAWGAAFIATAEGTRNAEGSTLLGSLKPGKSTVPAPPERAAQPSTHAG